METNKPVAAMVIAVVTIMLVSFFVVPMWRQSQALDKQLGQKQGEYDGKSMYYAAISETLISLQSRPDALGKVESSLPDQEALAPLLSFFQQQGSSAGVAVNSVAYAQEEPIAIAKTLPSANEKVVKDVKLVVELTGGYQGIKNFLQGLENSSRLIEVNSISLTPVQSLLASSSRQRSYRVILEVITHTY